MAVQTSVKYNYQLDYEPEDRSQVNTIISIYISVLEWRIKWELKKKIYNPIKQALITLLA